jgi:hypothetical protein
MSLLSFFIPYPKSETTEKAKFGYNLSQFNLFTDDYTT